MHNMDNGNGRRGETATMAFRGCAALVLAGVSGRAIAQENAYETADKSGYHLFNPTPVELRRPLASDRPDGTESPITGRSTTARRATAIRARSCR